MAAAEKATVIPIRPLKRKIGYEIEVPVKRMHALSMSDNDTMDQSVESSGSSD